MITRLWKNCTKAFNLFFFYGTIFTGSLTYSRTEDYLQKIKFNESVNESVNESKAVFQVAGQGSVKRCMPDV